MTADSLSAQPQSTDRVVIAAAAYFETFQGPWGLKASTEDAMLSVLVALYPSDYPAHDAAGIYKIRDDARMCAVAERLWDDLECQGLDPAEIATELVPMLDDAMCASLLAQAEAIGCDVEAERCDWYMVAEMLHEIALLPEAERAAAARACNDGVTPADRANYQS